MNNRSVAAPVMTNVALVYPKSKSVHGMVFARRVLQGLRDHEVNVAEYRLRSRTSPRVLWKEIACFRSFLRQEDITLVHAYYGTVTAAFCALCSETRLVITYCGSDLNPCPANNQLRWFVGYVLSQLAALRADRLICVSEGIRSRLWWRKADAEVIPDGVDLARFHPMNRAECRAALGWDEEPVVLFNAGLSPRVKRADLANEVFAQVRRVRSARLHVLRGHTDPGLIPTIMNAADSLLFTSDYEGSPNVVKEAVACGLPVVTVPVGDVGKTLADVEPSYIVSRNVQELAAAVIAVLDAKQRSNGAKSAARFSTARQAERLFAIYESLCGPPSLADVPRLRDRESGSNI